MQAGERLKTNDAGGLDMTCAEFLARHSEYMDGVAMPALAERLADHAASCSSCARYDRIVRRSADLVHDLPAVQPSHDFESRLQHRIFHVMDAGVLDQPRTMNAAVALGIAAMIALIAWSPVLLALRADADAAAVATAGDAADGTADVTSDAPARTAANRPASSSSNRGYPVPGVVVLDAALLGDAPSWYPMSMPPAPLHQPSDILALFPGPHSPLVVTPPSHRAVRAVSTSHSVE